MDAARVNLTGDGLEKVPVGKQTTFFIEGQTEMGDPEVKVLSPSRKVVPSSIRFVGEGHYGVDYHPVDVGDHQVGPILAQFYCVCFLVESFFQKLLRLSLGSLKGVLSCTAHFIRPQHRLLPCFRETTAEILSQSDTIRCTGLEAGHH